MTTATATITYRKTKTGEWVAFGPASVVRPGFVTLTKKSGETKQELIERVGRPFTVAGVEMVYGYLAHYERPAARSGGATRHEVSTPHGTRTVRHRAACTCWGCYDENN